MSFKSFSPTIESGDGFGASPQKEYEKIMSVGIADIILDAIKNKVGFETIKMIIKGYNGKIAFDKNKAGVFLLYEVSKHEEKEQLLKLFIDNGLDINMQVKDRVNQECLSHFSYKCVQGSNILILLNYIV